MEKGSEDNMNFIEEDPFKELGTVLTEIIQQEGIRNLKLILYCGLSDSVEVFRDYFGLEGINRRIWNNEEGYNYENNLVYIIEEKHKIDIDRILMLKTQDIAENHVFIL